MKKADKNNNININVIIDVNTKKTSSKISAAIIIALSVAVLAVSHYCPEMLASFIRWIISIAFSG